MLRRRHGGVAHAIAPEEPVEDGVVGSVGVREVEVAAFLPCGCVHFVEQTVVAIAEIGGECGLRAGTAEQRSHDRGARVVGIHGRSAKQGLDGADNVDGGVEVVVDEAMGVGGGGVFADDEGNAAMGIHVVGSILGVVFEDEDGGIVPVGAVGDGIDDAANGEIVVGD